MSNVFRKIYTKTPITHVQYGLYQKSNPILTIYFLCVRLIMFKTLNFFLTNLTKVRGSFGHQKTIH